MTVMSTALGAVAPKLVRSRRAVLPAFITSLKIAFKSFSDSSQDCLDAVMLLEVSSSEYLEVQDDDCIVERARILLLSAQFEKC
jgi:hypothetical protein